MATTQHATDVQKPVPNVAYVHQTSISARTVLSVQVTMSGSDMDLLCRILGNVDTYGLSDGENAVRREFIAAVESAR